MKPIKRCQYLYCKAPARSRGFCPSHYRIAQKRVKAGELTWEELQAAGLKIRVQRDESAFVRWIKDKAGKGRLKLKRRSAILPTPRRSH